MARVCDSNYYVNSRWKEISRPRLQEINGNIPVDEWMNLPYRFVYHFNAHFKKGVNIVEHHYRYRGFMNIAGNGFNYVLTAANRWANLPYAYRGYVFQDKYLKKQFESTDWYQPQPDATIPSLSEREQQWMEFWGK